MKEFKEIGLQYVADDGKKRFGGRVVNQRDLTNIHVVIVDFETEIQTENGMRTLVSFQYDDGRLGKYFTADKQQLWLLQQLREMNELPFGTIIKTETFGNGKVKYVFT